MLKNLIICPNCELKRNTNINGDRSTSYFKSILGEVIDNGDVLIIKKGNPTIISGSEFSVRCGHCGEEVFKRKNGTDSSQWSIRVSRYSFAEQTQGSITA